MQVVTSEGEYGAPVYGGALRDPHVRGPLVRYGLALALTAAAIGIASLLLPYTEAATYSPLLGAVAVSVWFGGLGPGLVSTLSGWALGLYLLSEPRFSFSIAERDTALRWGVSLVVALLLIWIAWVLRRGRERAVTAADDAERSLERVEHLHAIASTLSVSASPEEVAKAMVEGASTALGASGATLGLIEGEWLRLVDPIGTVRDARLDEGRVPLQAPMVLTAAAREGRIRWADSRRQLRREYPEGAERLPVGETVIAAPLYARGELVGALGFIFNEPGYATDENRSLARLVAELGGQALERAFLFADERRARGKLEQILSMAPRFQSGDEPAEIAVNVCASARESFGVDVAQVWTVLENGDFEVMWREPPEQDLPPGSVLPAADFDELPVAIAELRAMFVGDVPAHEPGAAADVRSALRIPIVVGGRAERVLALEWRRPVSEPDPSFVALTRRFADQAGLALEQAERRRAQSEAARRAEETRRLLDVTAALAAAVEVDAVAAAILAEARASLGAAAGLVARRLVLENELEIIRGEGFESSLLERWHRFSLDADLPLAEAVRENELVVIDSIAARDARYPGLAALPVSPGHGAWLAVPLPVGTRAVGGLALAFDASRRFSPADVDFVDALARQAGQAFERARLLEAEHEARTRAERIAAGLAQLHALSTSLSRALSAAEVVDAVGAQVVTVLDARAVGVYALDEGAGALDLLGTVGEGRKLAASRRLPLDAAGPLAEALRSAGPVWLERRDDWQRFPEEVAERLDGDISIVGVVPMFVQERPVGVLTIVLSPGHRVDDEQRRFAETVGRQAAQPLERVRLLDAERASRLLAEQATERTRRLQRATEALAAAATPGEVAGVVAREALAALQADCAGVYARQEDDGVELLATAGDKVAVAEPGLVSALASEVARSGGLVVRDTGVYAPLTLAGRTLGALHVGFREPRPIADEERELVITLARQCAQALDRARLFDLERAAAARVRRLQEVTAALSQAATPDVVGLTCLEQAAAAIGADRGVVALIAPDADRLDLVAALALDDDPPAGFSASALEGTSPLAEAARSGEPVWAVGPDDPTRFPALAVHGDRAWVALPLVGRGGTQGALLLAFADPPELDAEDRDWLVALAGQCAQALDRSRLFEDERATRRRSERLQALTAALSGSLTSDEVASVFLVQSIAALEADGAAIAVVDATGEHLQPLGWSGFEEKLVRERGTVPAAAGHPLADAFLQRQTLVFSSLAELEAAYPESAELARAQRVEASVLTPLLAGGRALGAAFFTWGAQRRLSADELAFVTTVASQCAQALDRARRYESERTIAETLQRSVLPERLPEVEGLELAARYLPGTAGVDVGGDWFDVIQLPNGRIGLAVGDVVGKGVRAAATMGQLRNALRAFALEQMKPSSAVTRLNRLVDSFSEAPFATLAYLTVDPVSRICLFTVAGHPPPLVRYPDGGAAYLEGGRSLPLGVGIAARYSHAVVELPAGATVLLYTDGLVERRDRPLEEGLESLRELVEQGPPEPEALVEHVLTGALGSTERADDVAVLAARLVAVEAETLRLELPAESEALVTMRAELRAWLDRADAPAEQAHAIVLAAWEACANAVEHAQEPTARTFWLEATRHARRIRLRVRDSGRWRPERARDDRGLGLRLIRSLMDAVEVTRGEDGTVVDMERGVGRGGGR